MSERNKVTVRIAGNEYVICGTESPEYIQKVALFVDRKLQEIMKRNHTLSTSMASVLTAVNIADESLKTSESLQEKELELSDLKRQNEELVQENEQLTADYSRARERESKLHLELARKEAEINEMRNTINTISNHKKLSE
ncbi:MAG TPA: cell division protein ZapA [Ruminiclostridium sp.]|nr:cell division protein ZapA [Ruminiclostridium sp.]